MNLFRRLARALLGIQSEKTNIQLKEDWNGHDSVTHLPEPTHPAPEADPKIIRPLYKLNGRHP